MTTRTGKIVGRPFRSGQSGNPGGRPKDENDIRNLARRQTRRALDRLIELIDSEDPRVALMAAREVLDRAYGKPKPQEYPARSEGLNIRIVSFRDCVDDHTNAPAFSDNALARIAVCSNDPVCADHDPATTNGDRGLHGAACHGCLLVAETSCEKRNEFLDRALLIETMGMGGANLF